jgi:hypothetical protein
MDGMASTLFYLICIRENELLNKWGRLDTKKRGTTWMAVSRTLESTHSGYRRTGDREVILRADDQPVPHKRALLPDKGNFY